MHTWPELVKAPQTAALAARSMSASRKTIIGSLPPSSRLTGINRRAARSAITLPVRTLPVNATWAATRAWPFLSKVAAFWTCRLVKTPVAGAPDGYEWWDVDDCNGDEGCSLPPAERKARAIHLLERVGLGHRAKHKPTELSGGEMQRAAIARSRASNPQIILADEPTGNLDAETGESVMKLLRDLNREPSMTMMIVPHDLNVARQADRIVRLNQGLVEQYVPGLAA